MLVAPYQSRPPPPLALPPPSPRLCRAAYVRFLPSFSPCPSLQLACDVEAVLQQKPQGLSSTAVVEHLARELTCLGYVVTLHSSLTDKHNDYLKNLRHTFLTCQAPGAAGGCATVLTQGGGG